MTFSSKFLLAAAIGSTASSFAASIPKTILPDNIVRCEPGAGCVNETLYGRNYKVMATPRFTVMVSISHEGIYTRADISVTNNTDMPLSVSPEDFRVEVVTPKPKVLLYIPPAELNLPEAKPAAAASTVQGVPLAQASASPSVAPSVEGSLPAKSEDAEVQKAAQREAAEKVAAQQHLAATSIPPSEVARDASTSPATRRLSLSMWCCPSLELSLNSRMRSSDKS